MLGKNERLTKLIFATTEMKLSNEVLKWAAFFFLVHLRAVSCKCGW